MIRKLPDFLVNIYVSGSVSPGAELRLATEEFMKGSHRADEYIRRYVQVWYQGLVKATVSGVFEDIKFKISEGYDQNGCFPDCAQLAVSV